MSPPTFKQFRCPQCLTRPARRRCGELERRAATDTYGKCKRWLRKGFSCNALCGFVTCSFCGHEAIGSARAMTGNAHDVRVCEWHAAEARRMLQGAA